MSATAGRLRGIYAIINEGEPNPVRLAEALMQGGVGIIQYRAKSGVVLGHARALRDLTADYQALYFINDDWQTAITVGADGVHLGPEDASAKELLGIRSQLGSRLLGLSCGTVEEAQQAQALGADYIGVGAVFATTSKADAGAPIGLT
ncbi:MAG: thiamine phosphate synthase, partial [Candidatus Eremiobacteraeota bacterium]|nr:thiamine phosphate synthase [Candidatus Eremiobacteraeota bacterium]